MVKATHQIPSFVTHALGIFVASRQAAAQTSDLEKIIDCGFIPGTYKGYWPNVLLGSTGHHRRGVTNQ